MVQLKFQDKKVNCFICNKEAEHFGKFSGIQGEVELSLCEEHKDIISYQVPHGYLLVRKSKESKPIIKEKIRRLRGIK